MLAPALIFVAYLLGSLSFAVIVSKLMRLPDPRSFGSGNPGATNVLRTGRKAAAALTLLGDAAKGWVAVAGARALGADEATVLLCALAVFLGHLYPVFFRFKGGKGVATALGVLLGIELWLGLACLATWLAMALVFRISSLAALVAGMGAPLYAGLILGWGRAALTVLVLAALLVYRHRSNLVKLIHGEEDKLDAREEFADETSTPQTTPGISGRDH